MKVCRIVQVKTHRLPESYFWCDFILSWWRPWHLPATCFYTTETYTREFETITCTQPTTLRFLCSYCT